MIILKLQTCKTGSQSENLLSVTIFMVFISFAEISAPSSASLFANGTNVSFPGPESTKSTRPWPSHEFFRSVIDGPTKADSLEETPPTRNSAAENIESRTMASSEETNTRRSFQTPAGAIGFPLRISATALAGRKGISPKEPVNYVKISGRRETLENKMNHWQTLNKSGIIVAQNRNPSPGFGWYSGGQDLYLPVGFSQLPGSYPQITTPFSPVRTSYYENYGTTGRPVLHPSTAYTKWYAPSKPEISNRPSVIIVKDKVSAHHWGSSGSTLPPQDFQYSGGHYVSSTPNPVQSTLISPFQQSGGEAIFGNNAFTQAPSSIWFKPTLNQYTTTVSPLLLTAKPENTIIDNRVSHDHNKNIMFKIWSYLEDGKLKLHGEKEIPAFILNGHTIKDGDILNIDHVPAPIRQLVSTSLNPTPGIVAINNDNTQWQQLPILIPGGSTGGWGWGKPPVKERPVSLNYVIWGSSTTPAPPTIATVLPTPEDYRKYLQEYLIRMTTPAPPKQDTSIDTWIILQNYFQNQMSTQIPIIQGQDPLRVGDMNNFANMMMLQTILSHLNKQANRDKPDSPKKPNDITRLTAPNRDSFWSSLYPIYQHLLTKRFKFPSIIRDDQTIPLGGFPDEPQSGPLSLSEFGTYGQSQNQNYGNSYGQAENPDPDPDNPISITESYLNSAESFHKTLIPKTGKSGRRGRKKKCKKYGKYHGHHGWGLLPNIINPENFDFKYKFGIDFVDIIKKKFYALLGVTLAPVVILSIAIVTPLAFLIWPQFFEMFKKGLKYYNPFKNHHNHHPHHHHQQHQIPHHQQPQLQYPHHAYQDFEQQQYYNPYQQSGYYQDNLYLGDNTGYFASKRDPPGVPLPNSFQNQYPASQVASLVEKKFGDKYPNGNATESWQGQISANTAYAYPNYGLKVTTALPYTEYNRNVMETLMRNKVKNTSPRFKGSPQGQGNFLGRSISNSSHGEGIRNNNTIVGQGKGKKRIKDRIVQLQIPSPTTITL